MSEQSIKVHLEDGDQLVWYNDPTIIATWHSNGRIDIFEKQNVSICDANFRILKGHWRDKTEHGVGTEPEHWLYNNTKIKEYLNIFPDFWKSTEQQQKQANKQTKKARKHKENTNENIKYEPVRVDDGAWTINDYSVYKEAENPSSSIKAYEVTVDTLNNYTAKALNIDDINHSGVYVLLNNNRPYYVGQADNTYNRVAQHLTDKHKDKFDTALLFVHIKDELTKDFQDTLEWRLIDEVIGRGSEIANSTKGNFKNADKVYKKHPQQYDEIINKIRECATKLGYDFLVRGTYINDGKNAIGTTDIDLKKEKTKISVICTPRWVIEDMLDLLPEEAFEPGTTIFDPAIKDGGFLQAIYERCITNKKMNETFNYNKDLIKAHIRNVKLYGVMQANTEIVNGVKIAEVMREYVCDNHLIVFDYGDKCEIFKEDGIKAVAESINEGFERDKDMKFDIVIGNPPYNNDVYIPFVEMGHQISTLCSAFITPAKWQAKGGKDNERFRQNIVPYMEKIVYYPVCWEVFGGDDYAKIHGGVSIYSISKEKTMCEINVISNIAKKLNDVAKGFSNTLFGNNIRDIINKTHTNGKIQVARIKNRWYSSEIYAVCGEVFSWGGFLNKDGQTFALLEPYLWNGKDAISNDTMIVGKTLTVLEAKSVVSYINTRLIRFLIWISCVSQHCGQDYTWRFVPDPGAFDHIFTDEELYKKYNLTDEEINIIESVIKERK